MKNLLAIFALLWPCAALAQFNGNFSNVNVDAGFAIISSNTGGQYCYLDAGACGPWSNNANYYTAIGPADVTLQGNTAYINFFSTNSSRFPWDGGVGYQIGEDNGGLFFNSVNVDGTNPQSQCVMDFGFNGQPQFGCNYGIATGQGGALSGPVLQIRGLDAGDFPANGFPESQVFQLYTATDERDATKLAMYIGAFGPDGNAAHGFRNFYWDWPTSPGSGQAFSNVDFNGVQNLTRVPRINGMFYGIYGDAGQLPLCTYPTSLGSIVEDQADQQEYICASQGWQPFFKSTGTPDIWTFGGKTSMDAGFAGTLTVAGFSMLDGVNNLGQITNSGTINADAGSLGTLQVNSNGAAAGGIITGIGLPCSCSIVAGTTCNCATTGSTGTSKCFFSLQGSGTASSAVGCECAASTNSTTMVCPTTTATFNIFTLN